MRVVESANLDAIREVLSHPDIWPAITIDSEPDPEKFDFSIYLRWKAIIGYVDEKPMAVMFYHALNDGQQLHIHVLPDYRKQYAREFAEKALAWASYPLYAEIPDEFPNVQKFAASFGFEPVSIFHSPYKRHGENYKVTRFARYQ